MPDWDAAIPPLLLDSAMRKRKPGTRAMSANDWAPERTPEEQALIDLWLQRKKIDDEKIEAARKVEILRAVEELRSQLRALGEKPCA